MLILLGVIALLLYILFEYLIPVSINQPLKSVISIIVILCVLLLYYVAHIRLG